MEAKQRGLLHDILKESGEKMERRTGNNIADADSDEDNYEQACKNLFITYNQEKNSFFKILVYRRKMVGLGDNPF